MNLDESIQLINTAPDPVEAFRSLRSEPWRQDELELILDALEIKTSPIEALAERWISYPDLFARDVFGLKLWPRQIDIVRSVALKNRVAVRSGHKCGKSLACTVLAFWWCLTHRQGQVILVAPSWKQITEVIWGELKRLYKTAKVPLGCQRPYATPNNGIRWDDGRSIVGVSAETEKEKVAGFSGDLLYIIDEASGVSDEIIDVANTAAGGSVVMISNPTRSVGGFYDAFHGRSEAWHTIHVSSEEAAANNPEVLPGKYLYPYLASKQWVDDRRKEYGDDSYFYDVRVRGVFPSKSADTLVSLSLVTSAQQRWTQAAPSDPLSVGVDVARFGHDDSVIVWRRGSWVGGIRSINGCDNVEVANMVRHVVAKNRRQGERVSVKVDTSNNGGVADILSHDEEFRQFADVHSIVASETAGDELDPETQLRCDRMRDVLWVRTREWLKAGGTIPPMEKRLASDLLGPKVDFNANGRVKIESKKELRKRIGKSPDAADALALSIYEPKKKRNAWAL